MQSNCDTIADPGRRCFVKQESAAGLLAAVAFRFPVAYGESSEQRGKTVKRTILMNGKFATPDPAKPQAKAVAIKHGAFDAGGEG